MKHLLFIVLFFFNALICHAQGNVFATYSKYFTSDSIFAPISNPLELPNGDVFMVGATINTDQVWRGTVLKLDAKGELLWAKNYGGGVYDRFIGAALSPDGYLYAMGDTRSYGSGLNDMLITKLDLDGNEVWTRVFGGPGDDAARAICVTQNNDVVVMGGVTGMGGGSVNIGFLRLDANGTLKHHKLHASPNHENTYFIKEWANNRILVLGHHFPTGTNADVLVMEIDSTGEPIWRKNYDSGEWDRFLGTNWISEDKDIYMAVRPGGMGWFDPVDIGLMKLDSVGNLQFAVRYPLSGNETNGSLLKNDNGFSLIVNTIHFGAYAPYMLYVDEQGVPLQANRQNDNYQGLMQSIAVSGRGGYLSVGIDTSSQITWVQHLDEEAYSCLPLGDTVTIPYSNMSVATSTPVMSVIDTGFLVAVNFAEISVATVLDTTFCYECPTVSANFDWNNQNYNVDFGYLGVGAADSIYWDLGDGNSSVDSAFTHTYTSAGSYQVCLYAYNFCGVDTFCRQVAVVCDAPIADFSAAVQGDTVVFEDLSAGSVTDYYWDLGDGSFSTAADFSHIYADTGVYQVCLYVTNECGLDTLCATVQIADVSGLSTVFARPQVTVYPNPTTGILQLQCLHTSACYSDVRVLDVLGRMVYELPSVLLPASIDLSHLPKGAYWLRFPQQNVTVFVRLQ